MSGHESLKSGASVARRPKALCDDPPVRASFVGVRGESFIRAKVQVALDGKTQGAAKFADFAHGDEAQFWCPHSKVAETEGNIVQPKLGEEAGALRRV
jgi:hypothetical protein